MHLTFELATAFGIAVVVVYLCHLIKISPIVGFLLTGILTGPKILGIVKSAKVIEEVAEIGVILLMFTIGIEFSVRNLLRIKWLILFAGSSQFFLVGGATSLIVFALTDARLGILSGALVALSSTAIVLKIMESKAMVESPHGKVSLAVLLFQDMVVIPLVVLLPILAGRSSGSKELLVLFFTGIGILVFAYIATRWVIPPILGLVVRTRIRELFLLTILVLCVLIPWLCNKAGLSMALGAFLAGLILSDSEYAHQALASSLPFRDLFTSIFFMSIGMLLDVSYVLASLGQVFLVTVLVVILKFLFNTLSLLIVGNPIKTALLSGIFLCQIGEFSFVLSKIGLDLGILEREVYSLFLGVAVLTMLLTPFGFKVGDYLMGFIDRFPFPSVLRHGWMGKHMVSSRAGHQLKDHLIIVGFGFTGRTIARAARDLNIPYLILEMNPATVAVERGREPIFFGDATQDMILKEAHIEEARAIAIAVPDPMAAEQITLLSKTMNPSLIVLVRTRFVSQINRLKELGAEEVIPEEFEGTIALLMRVLNAFSVPYQDIERLVAEARRDGYQLLRDPSLRVNSVCDTSISMPELEVRAYRVPPTMHNKSIRELEFRKSYGLTIIGVRSGKENIPIPSPDHVLKKGDILLLLGTSLEFAGLGKHLFEERQEINV